MSRQLGRGLRHISLARALHARLYVNCEGRIFAVDGHVSHQKLAQTLARHDRCPTVAEAPQPRDLGVPNCDGELSRHLLHCMSRALNRWRLELAAEARRRPARRRKATELARERIEIERLVSRLTKVRQWHAELAGGGEPVGAPFFLDVVAEAELQVALENAQREHPLPPLIVWQARVVCWLSGDCAARRFLSATTGLLSAYPQISRREQVRGLQRALIVWKRRSEQEPVRNLLVEVAQHIQQLPPDVVGEGKLSARLRKRAFGEYCDLLLERCSQLLAQEQLRRCHALPAALAALAAADDSAVELPQRCLRAGAEQEDFARLTRTIGKLAQQIGRPGYDALLVAIEQLPESPDDVDVDFDELRKLLEQGASVADAVWACERKLLYCLADSCLSGAAARSLDAAFAERGCPLAGDDLRQLVRSILRQEHLLPVNAWLAWLGCVSPRAITPRMRRVLRAAFWQRYLPSVLQHDWFEHLAPYLAATRRGKDRDDATPLLDGIATYQKFAGKQAETPKSLRKLLDSRERRRREREHLGARLAAGDLDTAAQARLRWLENDDGASPDAAKIRRAADEVFLLLGVETIDTVTRRLAEAKCRQHLGNLVALLARNQLWDFALWIDKMSVSQRDLLRELIVARHRDGREYKRHLADNQSWISAAVIRGFDLRPWFAAEPGVETIGGRKMEIVIASDLHNIFLMGAYFHTCLRLGDCNEMSVLANAYDANKQVVFVFTADDTGRRQVVARQIIAIGADFKLLGYCCYVNARHADKPSRQEYVNAVASYCGRLAARCGLELANQGAPEEIEGHFWYDDGEHEWPAAAQAAWAQSFRDKEELAPSAC